MSRVCLFLLAVLLACASAYEDATRKDSRIVDDIPVVIGELGKPLLVTCLESEDPTLFVFWYRGPGERELLRNGEVYGLRQNALLIRSLTIDSLGAYTCQAFNGIDMKPPRAFVVRASSGTQPTASVETSTITTTTTEALRFTDPVRKPAGVTGDENAVVTGELGSPLEVRCLAYGYPPPSVFWYHGFNEESMVMILHGDIEYEMRENLLTIKRLSMDSLGQYMCGAYNELGQPPSWKVVVRAYKPEWLFSENELLVPRDTMVSRPAQLPTEDTATTTTTSEPIEMARLLRVIETSTAGGFTETTEENTEVETTAHSATNEELVVPAGCIDNPIFANCNLVARSNFCTHKYYSKFCCKTCLEAGQPIPSETELQADQPLRNN